MYIRLKPGESTTVGGVTVTSLSDRPIKLKLQPAAAADDPAAEQPLTAPARAE